ncbi:MAG: hypothetical protein ABH832_04135 [bacterium]
MLIRPMEIIKQSLKLYQEKWRDFLPYLILLLVPYIAIATISIVSLYLSVIISSSKFISSLIVLAVFVLSMLFSLWVSISLVQLIHKFLNDKKTQPINWKELLGSNSHLMWPVIWTSAIAILIIIGGTILFIIPGIIFSIWYAFVSYEVVLENKKGMEALAKSKELVKGRWFGIVYRLFAPALIFIIAIIIVESATEYFLLFFLERGLWMSVTTGFLNSLFNVIITPLTTTAVIILYMNAKKNPVETKQKE